MKQLITDPKNDVLFKYIFGIDDEVSNKLLKVVIEGVTGLKVKELTILNPELIPKSFDEKNLILDIQVKDETGNLIDIEMQCYGPANEYMYRFACYGLRLASELVKKGKPYVTKRKVIQILFINGKNPYEDSVIEPISMQTRTHDPVPAYRIEPYYVYIQNIKEFDSKDPFSEIVYFFNHPDECDILKERNEMMAMMADKIEKFNNNEELVDMAYKIALSQQSIAYAKEIAREEGLAEGKAQGLAEGKAQGKAEGKAEAQREMAISLMKLGLDIEKISQVTGLSKEEINQL